MSKGGTPAPLSFWGRRRTFRLMGIRAGAFALVFAMVGCGGAGETKTVYVYVYPDAGEDAATGSDGGASDSAADAPAALTFGQRCDPAWPKCATAKAQGAQDAPALCPPTHSTQEPVDMYGRCTFECDPLEARAQLCVALGGTCKVTSPNATPICVPN